MWRVGRGPNRRRVDRSPEEASRPGLPRAARRALAAAAGLALLLLAGLGLHRFLTSADAMRIRAVRFPGASRAAEAELLALSPAKSGDQLLALEPEAVQAALERHPWVKSARATRRFPPALEVAVVEREPAALVDLGGLYLVDRDAHVFKRAASGDGLDLPVITGFARDDYLQRRAAVEQHIAGALALLDGYAREGLGALASVSEVHVDPDEGVTLYIGEEGTQVRLGVGDLPQKLSRLHRILSALRAEGRKAEVLHLDNRTSPNRVTVRLAGRSAEVGPRSPASRTAGKAGPRGP